MNFGEKIKHLRRSQNMSQQELANSLKVNRNLLSRIETEKTEPTVNFVKDISSFFGININSLLDIDTTGPIYEEKIKYVTENCKLLLESDLDFLVRIISIMKEEYVKKNRN